MGLENLFQTRSETLVDVLLPVQRSNRNCPLIVQMNRTSINGHMVGVVFKIDLVKSNTGSQIMSPKT